MPRFGAVALLLALAGCATVAPPAEQPVALVLEESWSWQGRISVKAGEQAVSGQLQWQHQPDSDALMFTSRSARASRASSATPPGSCCNFPTRRHGRRRPSRR